VGECVRDVKKYPSPYVSVRCAGVGVSSAPRTRTEFRRRRALRVPSEEEMNRKYITARSQARSWRVGDWLSEPMPINEVRR
jgi:hypothetical protein